MLCLEYGSYINYIRVNHLMTYKIKPKQRSTSNKLNKEKNESKR